MEGTKEITVLINGKPLAGTWVQSEDQVTILINKVQYKLAINKKNVRLEKK